MGLKICIDPGHGGTDPGAIGPHGMHEKDIVLLVAHELKRILHMDCEIAMTRYSDIFVSLNERADCANREGADFFISLHCNAAGTSQAHGAETFHFPGSSQGAKLAGSIQRELVVQTGVRDRGTKTANFAVLKGTQMPAVLVELGFISNPEEEQWLGDIDNQVLLAQAIAKGIRHYIKGVK